MRVREDVNKKTLKRILFVDDDELIRHWLETVLRDRGYEVTACSNGEDAWELCGEETFQIFVLDWLLPGISGPELCRKIRSAEWGESAVILMLTAKDKEEDMQAALKAGADDYLIKPIDIELLDVRLAVAEREVCGRVARKKAEDGLRELLQRRKAMAEMGIEVSQAHTIREATQAIADAAILLARADVFRLYLRDEDGAFRLRAQALGPGTARTFGEGFTSFRVGEGISGHVVQSGVSIVVEDVGEDPRWVKAGWSERVGIKSYAGFPIRRGGSTIGVLAVHRRGQRPFTGDDIESLEILASYASIAVENILLIEEAKDHSHRLELAGQIAKAVGSELEPEELFRVIAREIRRAIPCDRFVLASLDLSLPRHSYWHVNSDIEVHGMTETERAEIWRYLMDRLYRPKRSFYLADLSAEEPSAFTCLVKAGLRSYLAVPVLRNGRCVAHLALASRRPDAFTESQAELIGAVAGHLGTALRNATLFRTAERRGKRLATLVEVAQRLTRGLELDSLLRSIVEAAAMVFEGEAVFLQLEGGELAVVSATPGVQGLLTRECLRSGESVLWQVAVTGKTFVTQDLAAEDAFEFHNLPDTGEMVAGALMALPVRVGSRVVGALAVFRKRGDRFSEEDVDLANSFADQAAVSIENARLMQAEKKSRGFLQSIVGDSGDAIVVSGPEQEITLWNRGAEQLFGYAKEEAEGSGVNRVLAPTGQADFLAGIYDEAWESGAPQTVETQCIQKDGGSVSVSLTVSPVREEGGQIVAAAGIFTDLTERKEAEELLARVNQSLEEKNKDLETIFQVASHDLRNPLVNIQGYSKELGMLCEELHVLLGSGEEPDVLRKKAARLLEEEIPDALRYVLAGVSKMDMLLSGLMRFSRLGRMALSIECLDMNRLLNHIAHSMEYQIKEAGARLEISHLPPCRGDEGHVVQVFSNLMDNAMKYLEPSRPGCVRVSGRSENGNVIYSVEDNGVGIPEAYHAKIFEIFHRLNHAKARGEGLGLTLSLRIVERMNGRIWVESKHDIGSRFYVSLPACAEV